MTHRLVCCALLTCVLGACSVLVDPGSLVIKCEVPVGRLTADPCAPAGMHCVEGECKPCVGESEICNGEDDDCDGVIDNGADQDNDGFTWCGGGRAEFADCAPNDPNIHPARPAGPDGDMVPAPKEECDGKDNDCDSKVDEAPECAAMMHKCERDEECAKGQICNVSVGVCLEPRPVGSGCQVDSDCTGGLCVKKGQYNLGVDLPDNRCASACCTDADCPSGSVCLAGDAGVRVCLPADIAARGTSAEGDRCTRDTECASGSCVGSRCALRCSLESACKTTCALSAGGLSEARRWVCSDARGREAAGGICIAPDPGACRSGLCGDRGTCVKVCGRNADCDPDEGCSYETVRGLSVGLPIGPTAVVSFCAPRADVQGDPQCCTKTDCDKGKQCMPGAIEGGFWTMVCR